MSVESEARKQLMNEIINRKMLGDKNFHSETSIEKLDLAEAVHDPGRSDGSEKEVHQIDPGVVNSAVKPGSRDVVTEARRRAMSTPGPISGSLLTATAARAARKRLPRNIMYADPSRFEPNEKQPPKFLTPYDGDNAVLSDRSSPVPYPSNNRSNGDARSLNSYRLYAPNDNMKGASTPRKRSVVTMDAQSIRSVETHAPAPTTPEANKKYTTESISLTLGYAYTMLILTLGLIIYLSDAFIDTNVAPYYSLLLASMGILYMVYLIFDITKYKKTLQRNEKIKEKHEEALEEYFRKQEEIKDKPEQDSLKQAVSLSAIAANHSANLFYVVSFLMTFDVLGLLICSISRKGCFSMESGNVTPSGTQSPDIHVRIPQMLPPPVLLPLTHEYCFSQGRHSGSFYLKMGAAAFALGHLVHSVLLITVQIAYYFDENITNEDCVNNAQVALDIVNPLYCFLQLYFIFKYSNVIILKNQALARFAFMHFIGTSLCFWLSAIVRETILGLTLYAQTIYGGDGYTTYSDAAVAEVTDNVTRIESHYRFMDISGLYNEDCVSSSAMSSIYGNFSPYLFPFSVEFNILIVAVYYIILNNVGKCEQDSNDDDSINDENMICKLPSASEENDFSSNMVIYADCHASNRGLFAGLLIMVIVVGTLIIGFVLSSVGDDYLLTGTILNNSTKLFLHVCMLIGSVIAYNQIRTLDINEHPISLLDDILLFICLPAFFLETVLSLIATISFANVVKATDFCVMVVQIVLQTALIVDGLRRCSNTRKLRRKKPGRELIMFLLIINVAMWINYTFSYKSPESLDERYAYYGKVLWTILGHISLPLMMFYRFHSSVCFADIWDSAYKPGSEH